MKFAVTKEALLDGLQRIQNVVSTRSTLPVLTNALLETSKTGLRLTTTDLEVSVRCEVAAQVEKPGSTTLPARRLSAIVRSLTADKGYFAIEEIAQIQEFDIRTVIGDANAARCQKEGLAAPLRKALHRACAVKSQSGKAFLRKRGMHLERSFEHVLDEGGLRRATLEGTENLTKRHKIAAACFNLSLLMRTLLGIGTPKQWMAGADNFLEAFIAYLGCGIFMVP